MKHDLFDCSPKAKEKIKTYDDLIGIDATGEVWAKYPFRTMKIGKCFIVAFEAGKDKSLRTLAAQWKVKTGKVFIVIKHKESKLFEVARIS